MAAASAHPIAQVLEQAARGVFPAPRGTTTVLPPCAGQHGVVAMTAAVFILTEIAEPDVLRHLDQTVVGAASRPPFLAWLAQESGMECGFLDVILARRGIGGEPHHLRDIDAHDSSRVARSERHRNDVRILADAARESVVTIGRGLAGRREMSIELPAERRFDGLGRQMLHDGLRAIGAEEVVFAQVSPGNAASLRAFLAADFRPIGSEALFTPSP